MKHANVKEKLRVEMGEQSCEPSDFIHPTDGCRTPCVFDDTRTEDIITNFGRMDEVGPCNGLGYVVGEHGGLEGWCSLDSP